MKTDEPSGPEAIRRLVELEGRYVVCQFFIVSIFLVSAFLPSRAYAEGLGRCGTGNYQQTLDECTAAINSGTLNRKEMSFAYERLGSADEPYFDDTEFAIRNLNMAIQLDPMNIEAYFYRGMVMRNRTDLEKVIQLTPDLGLAERAKEELDYINKNK